MLLFVCSLLVAVSCVCLFVRLVCFVIFYCLFVHCCLLFVCLLLVVVYCLFVNNTVVYCLFVYCWFVYACGRVTSVLLVRWVCFFVFVCCLCLQLAVAQQQEH